MLWAFLSSESFASHLSYEMVFFMCRFFKQRQTSYSMNVSRLFSKSTCVFQLAFCSEAIMMGPHPRFRLGGNAETPFQRVFKS